MCEAQPSNLNSKEWKKKKILWPSKKLTYYCTDLYPKGPWIFFFFFFYSLFYSFCSSKFDSLSSGIKRIPIMHSDTVSGTVAERWEAIRDVIKITHETNQSVQKGENIFVYICCLLMSKSLNATIKPYTGRCIVDNRKDNSPAISTMTNEFLWKIPVQSCSGWTVISFQPGWTRRSRDERHLKPS